MTPRPSNTVPSAVRVCAFGYSNTAPFDTLAGFQTARVDLKEVAGGQRAGAVGAPLPVPICPSERTTERGPLTVEVPHISDGVVFRVLQNLLILDGERLSYYLIGSVDATTVRHAKSF